MRAGRAAGVKGELTAAAPGGLWHPAGSRWGAEGVASGERPEPGCRSPGPGAVGRIRVP